MIRLIVICFMIIGCKPVGKLSSLQNDGVAAGACRSAGMNNSVSLSSGQGSISGADRLANTTYVISDSGNSNRLGSMVDGSNTVHWQDVAGMPGQQDWEALAVGPCPQGLGAASCAYIADMGDNGLNRSNYKIHIVSIQGAGSYRFVKSINVSFGDGQSHNVEAIAIDSKAPYDLYIINKYWEAGGKTDAASKMWKLPASQLFSHSATLEHVCNMVWGNNWENQITGADIEGNTLVYRGYHYVSAMPMDPIRTSGKCIDTPGTGFAHHEDDNKSEAIAFTSSSGGLLTINEDSTMFEGSICLSENPQPGSGANNSGNTSTGYGAGTGTGSPGGAVGSAPAPAVGTGIGAGASGSDYSNNNSMTNGFGPNQGHGGGSGLGVGSKQPPQGGSGQGSKFKQGYCSWIKDSIYYNYVKGFANLYCGF